MLQGNDIVEGSWTDKPSGCSFGPIIHYNTHPTGFTSSTKYKLHFKTDSTPYSKSNGPFEILGYGTISKECHNSLNAECDIEIDANTMDTLTIVAKTTDGWRFTISGDIGGLLNYKTVAGGSHYPPFPTWIDTDGSDSQQTYALTKFLPICNKMEVNRDIMPFMLERFIFHNNLTSPSLLETCTGSRRSSVRCL